MNDREAFDNRRALVEQDDEIEKLRQGIQLLRNAIHACNRNPIPNSQRVKWRNMCDSLLSPGAPHD